MSARATLPLVLTALAACGTGESPAALESSPATFELRDVVSAALAGRPAEAPAPELRPDQVEELEGLTSLVASDASLLSVAREDARRIGRDSAAAWLRLVDLARDADRPDLERAAAVDLIDAGDPAGARALLGLVTDAQSSWLRARAAWRLASDGPDHLVPTLVLRLKYETDHETVVWIAAALARHDNLAGLEGLVAIAGDAASPARANAARALEELRARHGLRDAPELEAAWAEPAETRGFGGEPRSERYRFAVLEWIARLAEFQLRGVDDARFILERLDAAAARELGAALSDRDVYVRVHSAQCLQRMGRRGAPAGPELLAALAEPEVAPHAAVALGRVGHAPAEGALVALLAPGTPAALRLAATRGLGYLPSLSAQEAGLALLPLLEAEPAELAQAAAESLLRRHTGSREAVASLARFLEDGRVDPGSSERALGEWLEASGETRALARWEALRPPPDRIERPEATRARRAERARVVVDLLGSAADARD